MQLILVGGLLAVIAFFTNLRLVAVCLALALGGHWLYHKLPYERQRFYRSYYDDLVDRSQRAWDEFCR